MKEKSNTTANRRSMALRVLTLLLAVFLVVGLMPTLALGNGEEEQIDSSLMLIEQPAQENGNEGDEKLSGGDEAISVCTVNFWVAGDLYQTITVEKGLAIEQRLVPDPPELEDQDFIEWCDALGGAFDINQAVTQDTDIFARYSEPEIQNLTTEESEELQLEGEAVEEEEPVVPALALLGIEPIDIAPASFDLPLGLPQNSDGWTQAQWDTLIKSGIIDVNGADVVGSLISINGHNSLSFIVYNPNEGKIYLFTYSISNQHPVTLITVSGTGVTTQANKTASWTSANGAHRVFVFDAPNGLPGDLTIKGNQPNGQNIDNSNRDVLVLTAKHDVVVYDGREHALPTPASTNTISGVAIKIEYWDAQERVWTTAAPKLSYSEVGTYTLPVRASALNYTTASGTISLEIVPREITVKPADETKIFDGKELVASELILASSSPNGLAPGQRLDDSKVVFGGSQSDPGTSNSSIKDKKQVIIRNEKNVDVTSNYLINILPGALTVKDKYTVVYEPGLQGAWDAADETYEGLQPGDAIPAFASNASGNDTSVNCRAGWVFTGWVSAEGVDPTGVVPQGLSNCTISFVAQWEPAVYQIRYIPNGGTGSMSSTTVTFGEFVTLADNSFTRAGYSFVGWSTYFKSSRALYLDGASFVYGMARNMTLFAIWAESDGIVISYEAGTGGAVSLSSETLAPVTGVALGSTATADEDFTFVNWTNAAGDVVSTDELFKPERVNGLNVEATYFANFAEIPPQIVIPEDPDQDPDPEPGPGPGPQITDPDPGTGPTTDPDPDPIVDPDPEVVSDEPDAPAAGTDEGVAPIVALTVVPETVVPEPEPVTTFEQIIAEIFGEDVPTATVNDDQIPLAAIGYGAWALLNLIMMAVGALLAVFMLVACIRGRQAEKRDERTARRTQRQEGTEKRVVHKKASRALRIIAAVLAVAAIILFILVEDMTLKMVLIDQWTIAFLAILVVQTILWIVASRIRRAKEQAVKEEKSVA
ncbi:MAG: InlB B-repeat-containing protein [Coriobacteriia bacterium]|nr:InlB B-repeat-containing protein [Coriobacteriia bacterium]